MTFQSGVIQNYAGPFFWRFIQATRPLEMLFSGLIGFPSKAHFCQSEGARVVLNYTQQEMSFVNSKQTPFPGLVKQDFWGSGGVQIVLTPS